MSLLWGFVSKTIRPLAAVSSTTTSLFHQQARNVATNNTSLFGRWLNNNNLGFLNNSNNNSYLLTTLRFRYGGKTNKSAAKRFRVRGSGSLKRMKSGRSHNTGYKQRQRVNRLGRSTGVKGKKIEKNIRKLIGAL